jgi:hypothetical protein
MPMATQKVKASDGAAKETEQLSCGLVMPISSIDGCTAEHWTEVKSIITEAIEAIVEPKFLVRLVSDADDVGVIQKRIVQNIYNSDVMVCDVSCKNPNVMFELGMRLAFDKPTVIIKDDKTDYSFDTGVIEHVPYPRDLRFTKMVAFKTTLAAKVLATYRAAKDNPDHSTFLKNFGSFHVANLSQDAVPADKLILEMLADLQTDVATLRRRSPREANLSRGEIKSDEGFIKLVTAIGKLLAENPNADIGSLAAEEATKQKIISEIEAQRHYPMYGDFVVAYEKAFDLARALRK